MTFTKIEGSRACVNNEASPKLEIFVSTKKIVREHALVKHLPTQLLAALTLQRTHSQTLKPWAASLTDVPLLCRLLREPCDLLNTLLDRTHIGAGISVNCNRSSDADSDQDTVKDGDRESENDEPSNCESVSDSNGVLGGVEDLNESVKRLTISGSEEIESVTAAKKAIDSTSHSWLRSGSTLGPRKTLSVPAGKPPLTTSSSSVSINTRASASLYRSTVTKRSQSQGLLEPLAGNIPEKCSVAFCSKGTVLDGNRRTERNERVQAFARDAASALLSRTAARCGKVSTGMSDKLLDPVDSTPSHDLRTPGTPGSGPEIRGEGELYVCNHFKRITHLIAADSFQVDTLLAKLKLPGFDRGKNWTSALRKRAGMPGLRRDELVDITTKLQLDTYIGFSDLYYEDIEGWLTEYLRDIEYPYVRPAWLSTICTSGNKPTYLMEVKSTKTTNEKADFQLNSAQWALVCFQSTAHTLKMRADNISGREVSRHFIDTEHSVCHFEGIRHGRGG